MYIILYNSSRYFQQQSYSIIQFVCPLVHNRTGEICFFSTIIEVRQLKFAVQIPMTFAHLVYTLFCSSVFQSCFKIHKPFNFYRFQDFFKMSFCILTFFCPFNDFCALLLMDVVIIDYLQGAQINLPLENYYLIWTVTIILFKKRHFKVFFAHLCMLRYNCIIK